MPRGTLRFILYRLPALACHAERALLSPWVLAEWPATFLCQATPSHPTLVLAPQVG
jgi:hypothetical protein